MKRGICKRCKKFKPLTKHSKTGNHQPPFEYLCRDCHDEKHDMKPNVIKRQMRNFKKYQPGTKRQHKRKWYSSLVTFKRIVSLIFLSKNSRARYCFKEFKTHVRGEQKYFSHDFFLFPKIYKRLNLIFLMTEVNLISNGCKILLISDLAFGQPYPIRSPALDFEERRYYKKEGLVL